METIFLTVSVDEMGEYIGDVDVDVELSDEHYEAMAQLVESYREKSAELSVELFEKELPDVYNAIRDYVYGVMPDMIEIDEDLDQDISDFSWYIQYPDDICDLF